MLRKFLAAAVLAAALCPALGSNPAYGKTQSAKEGYLRSDEIDMSGYGSSYLLSDGTGIDIEWVKVGSGNAGFAGKEPDSGEQTMIMPVGYKMTYWFVIDNGFRQIKTEPQQVVPLYIEYVNENAAGPADQFLYKENPNAANTVCYDMPQGFDYEQLGDWIISVKRVIRITNMESGAVYEGEEPEVYLSGESGSAAILELSPLVYRVETGDTLWEIADRLYHNPGQWEILYRQNQFVIRNPDQIYAGQMILLTLPDQSEDNTGFR